MKVCVIRPAVIHKELALTHMPTAPLGPAYIAAVLKQAGNDVQVIDAAIEGYHDVEPFIMDTFIFGLNAQNTIDRIEQGTAVICISFMFTNNWYFDRELVRVARIRFPEAIIVGGGEHATAVPKYCFDTAPDLNFIVLGEGEATMLELMECIKDGIEPVDVPRLAYIKNGELCINNSQGTVRRAKQIDEIPWPAWELFPLDKYFDNKISYGVYRGNSLPMLASRGCPYECTFCSNPQMWGRLYKLRNIKDLVDEMEYLKNTYNVTNFDFYDLTAVLKKQWILEMCDAIIERNLNITYQIPAGTRSEAIDYEVAYKLFHSGCKNISYAPESGSKTVLRDMKKKINLQSIYDSIRHSNKVGMNIKLNIIVGMPGETHKDVWLTLWFLVRSSWYGAHDMYPGVFSPYPGSELFDRLSKQGKVDIYSDDYINEVINSHDFWPGKTYNDEMTSFYIRLYSVLMYVAFYGTNFLFRPIRIYRIVRNLMNNTYESRSEFVIYQTLLKLKLVKAKEDVKAPVVA